MLATTVAAGLPETLGVALTTAVVTALPAEPPLSAESPQPASVAVMVSSPKTRPKSPHCPSIFTCSPLAIRLKPLRRSGEVHTDRREAGIDGGAAMRSHRFLAGNPAISCPYRT